MREPDVAELRVIVQSILDAHLAVSALVLAMQGSDVQAPRAALLAADARLRQIKASLK